MRRICSVAVLAGLALVGCRQSAKAPSQGGMAGMDMGSGLMPGMLTSPEMRQLDAAHDTAFDRLYLTGMIKHHQGAIAMVAALFATPRGGQQSELFSLATDVDAGQRVEIARMQAMLRTLTPTPPT